MANIWAAVGWWDEWQMRILISGSLFIQWFLLLAAPLRMYSIQGPIRFLIMLAYGSSDALAIYALATLFNRQAQASSPCHVGYKASSIEVLWAPILLIHLGGRENITAINIEENELWTRQAVTVVSQVTIAVYSFYKTWPTSGDNRLLWSAILLFVIGILSFCEKPWALRRASINRLMAVSSFAAGSRKKPTRLEFCFTEFRAEDIYLCLKKKMRLLLCRRHIGPNEDHQTTSDEDAPILTALEKLQMILSDLSLLAAATDLKKQGRSALANSILEPMVVGGERNLKHWMRWMFKLIYTRANVIFTPAYLAGHLVLVPSLHVAAIVLFATSHKQAYRQFNAIDVRMTYVVLCLTAVLDVFGLPISALIHRLMARIGVSALCATLPGQNLIDGAREYKNPLWWLLNWLGCYELGFSKRDPGNLRYLRVAGMVVLELASSGDDSPHDFASYRSPSRAKNWILGKLDAPIFYSRFGKAVNCQTAESLRGLAFDMSVLRWHIATDLCFRSSSNRRLPDDSQVSLHRVCAQGISNYMAHLLYSRPEMLMTGSRKHLFVEAMEKTSHLLDKNQFPLNRDDVVVEMFINATVTPPPLPLDCPTVVDACKLAKELLELREEATRWEVMYRVWMGMLCYSASMCRGYLHAKTLGEGGEFLSFISVIMALRLEKTLADKLQMPDHGAATEAEDHGPTKEEHGLFGRIRRRVLHRRSQST